MTRIFNIAVFVLASLSSWGQNGMLLAVPSAATADTFLLDQYPGAEAAYSINQLRGGATLCMTIVRENLDTLDVGFSGGDFDSATASAFVGSGNGYAYRLYDQTGNGNHVKRSTLDTAAMARIYEGGVLQTQNGRAALNCDGSNSYGGPTVYTGTAHSTFSVVDFSTVDVFEMLVAQSDAAGTTDGQVEIRRNSTSTGLQVLDGLQLNSTGISINSQAVYSIIRTGSSGSLTIYHNGTSAGTGTTNTNGAQSEPLSVVSRNLGLNLNGFFQSLIIYNSDQSSNRTAIETILNNYFSIY